jgi:hypothetical protein
VIDAMTLFEVAELTGYWAEHPPVHIALAGFLGIRGRRPVPKAPSPAPSLHAVLGALGPGFAAGAVDAGLPPVVLDFAALARAVAA